MSWIWEKALSFQNGEFAFYLSSVFCRFPFKYFVRAKRAEQVFCLVLTLQSDTLFLAIVSPRCLSGEGAELVHEVNSNLLYLGVV